MKQLKDFIIEKQNFLIKNKDVLKDYNNTLLEYFPKTTEELEKIIIDLLKKGITDLNCIDVSKITNMCWLFSDINKIVHVKYIDISEWDVSNVIDMSSMFEGCNEFNSNLSNWNVSKVKNIRGMFNGCNDFNSDLSEWNISKHTLKGETFKGCIILKENNLIPKWYTGNV